MATSLDSTGNETRSGDDSPRKPQSVPRWLIEHNPVYLLSAALVLAGCLLMSRGLASQDSLGASLGVSLLSEVYAVSLLGGAALLTRIGPRRPAVILALLFVLYQWDLTLHTETCAYLGSAGTWAAAAWLAIFVGKIYGLAWALRVRFARHLVVAAIVAAIGLVIVPRILPDLGARNGGALLGAWAFALGALYRSDGISSLVELTPWGHTVLRRTTRAAWLLSGALLSVHALFWARDHELALSSALPVVPLLFMRRVRSETRMWTIAVATLAFVALLLPGSFFVTALLTAAALVLRALSPTFRVEPEAPPQGDAPEHPYRASGAPAHEPPPAIPIEHAPVVGPAERARSFAGAVFAVYLAAWTLDWSGGLWPAHVAALDVALTVALLVAVWRLRVRSPLALLATCYAHLVVQENLVTAPRTAVQWGATAIALGFVLLAGSLATSYRFRARSEVQPRSPSG